MTNFIALAERCESAVEADRRELDLAIMQARSGKPWRWADLRTFEPQTVITWDEYGHDAAGNPFCTLETFTQSIDAAMALLPSYMSSELTQSAASAFTRCRLWDWRRSTTMSDPGNEWRAEGSRPLPLNICAALLRALADGQS